jgi:hypothetical protein
MLPEKKAAPVASTANPFSAREAQLSAVNEDRPNPFANLSSSGESKPASTFSFSFGGAKPAADSTDATAAAPKFNFSFGKSEGTTSNWADKPAVPAANGEAPKFAFSFGGGGFGAAGSKAPSSTNFFQTAVKASADLADEKNKTVAAGGDDVVADADVNISSLSKVENKFAAAPVIEAVEEEGANTILTVAGCKALRYCKDRKEWVEKGVGSFVVSSKEVDGKLKYRGTMHSQFTKALVMYLPIDKSFGVKGCNGANVTAFVGEMDEATKTMKPSLYCIKCPCEADSTKVSETLTSLADKARAAQ